MKTTMLVPLVAAATLQVATGCRKTAGDPIPSQSQVIPALAKATPAPTPAPSVAGVPNALGQAMQEMGKVAALAMANGTPPLPARQDPNHPHGLWVPVVPSRPGEGIWGISLVGDGNLSLYPGLDEETVTGRARLRRCEGRLTHQITLSSGRTAYDLVLILEQLENPDRANLYMPKDYDQARRIWQSIAGGRGRPPEGSMNSSEMIRIVDPNIPRESWLGGQLQTIALELREARLLERQLRERQAALRSQRGTREVLAELAGNDREIKAIKSRAGQLARARGELEAALRTAARKRSIVGLDDDSFVRVERMLLELEAAKPKADTLDLFEGDAARQGNGQSRQPATGGKPW